MIPTETVACRGGSASAGVERSSHTGCFREVPRKPTPFMGTWRSP